MKINGYILASILLVATPYTSAEEAPSTTGLDAPSGEQLRFNVSILKPAGDDLKRSTLRAVLSLDWSIEQVGGTFVVGSLKDKRIRVEFDDGNNITIFGMNGTAEKWLKKFQRRILIELSYCGGI